MKTLLQGVRELLRRNHGEESLAPDLPAQILREVFFNPSHHCDANREPLPSKMLSRRNTVENDPSQSRPRKARRLQRENGRILYSPTESMALPITDVCQMDSAKENQGQINFAEMSILQSSNLFYVSRANPCGLRRLSEGCWTGGYP